MPVPPSNPFHDMDPSTALDAIGRMIELIENDTRPGDALRQAFGAEAAGRLIGRFAAKSPPPPGVTDDVMADVLAAAFAQAMLDWLTAIEPKGPPEGH